MRFQRKRSNSFSETSSSSDSEQSFPVKYPPQQPLYSASLPNGGDRGQFCSVKTPAQQPLCSASLPNGGVFTLAYRRIVNPSHNSGSRGLRKNGAYRRKRMGKTSWERSGSKSEPHLVMDNNINKEDNERQKVIWCTERGFMNDPNMRTNSAQQDDAIRGNTKSVIDSSPMCQPVPTCNNRDKSDFNANSNADNIAISSAPVFFIGDSTDLLQNDFDDKTDKNTSVYYSTDAEYNPDNTAPSYCYNGEACNTDDNIASECNMPENDQDDSGPKEPPKRQLSAMSTGSSTLSESDSDGSNGSNENISATTDSSDSDVSDQYQSVENISGSDDPINDKCKRMLNGFVPTIRTKDLPPKDSDNQNGTIPAIANDFAINQPTTSLLRLRRSSSCNIAQKDSTLLSSSTAICNNDNISILDSNPKPSSFGSIPRLPKASSCHALATMSLGVRLETVYGLCLPWLPFKWLREPECFVEDQRGVKVKNRIHKHADSLFSTSSGFTDFRGFFNLAVLLLVLSSARVALENVIKYGILVNPAPLIPLMLKNPYSIPSPSLVIFSNVFIFIAFSIEKLLASKWISEGLGSALLWINVLTQITFPCYVILAIHPNPVFSSVALLINTMVFLKLISYKQTLCWCRQDRDRMQVPLSRNRYKSVSAAKDKSMEEHFEQNGKVETLQTYPDNLTLKDLYYFMLAPTLCYELHFPRTSRIRKRFLFKRIIEVAFISGLILALIQQWVLPLITNALVPFNQMYLPLMLERILKLALPNFCIWLLWFYSTFHSMFNVLAEVLMFADRVFYHDWWNSETVAEFWQKWNIPVHRWATRHVYKPMLSSGYTKIQGVLTVFLLSAAFHEILVSIPLGIFRLYAFMGMVLQVPLAILTQRLHPVSPKLCNVIVWCSLIIGQPIALLMYYVDYYISIQT